MEMICTDTTARDVNCQILPWKLHVTLFWCCINFRPSDPITGTVFSQTQRRLTHGLSAQS
jgi:hypothetical protein